MESKPVVVAQAVAVQPRYTLVLLGVLALVFAPAILAVTINLLVH